MRINVTKLDTINLETVHIQNANYYHRIHNLKNLNNEKRIN